MITNKALERMWLDLGCGGSPRGDVNLDLFTDDDSPHTTQLIDPKEINNFVIGSADLLSFRTNSMWGVSGYHLIEHLLVPTTCLADMARVAIKWLIIAVPNHPMFTEHHSHYYSWSKVSLEALLSEYGEVVYSETRFMWWNSKRVLRIIKKIPILAFRRIAYHLLNFLFGLEIIVVVELDN